MNCADARELLSDVAGGELDGTRADEARAHAASCERCAAELEALTSTVGLLRSAGQEPLPEGFSLSLHQALVAAGPPRRSWLDGLRAALAARPLGFAAGLAALAALVAAGGTFVLMHRPAAPLVAAYKVPESKLALVKIDFVAEQTIDGVAFEITLPDGLRFVSGGTELAERTFRFQGKLQAGNNPIAVAVKGPRAGRYKVIAHAVGPALDVTHEVVLEVTT